MKKGPEIHPALVWGIIALVVIGAAIFGYMKISPPTPQVDVNTLSPDRLEDPDRRGGG